MKALWKRLGSFSAPVLQSDCQRRLWPSKLRAERPHHPGLKEEALP